MSQPIIQNADIRYLGRVLGDVIRTYAGDALFQRIEQIRAASVERHRSGAETKPTGLGLRALTLDETPDFARSFMLFSMLANLAEDRMGVATDDGADMAHAMERLETLQDW